MCARDGVSCHLAPDDSTAPCPAQTGDVAHWQQPLTQGLVVAAGTFQRNGGVHVGDLFGHRLRQAGLLGSMGRIGCGLDNAMAESFFGSMQIELLDRRRWTTRDELATALFDWIEAFYNPTRRHSALGYLSPIAYERAHTPAATAA